jgi:hypothetical protein
VKRSADAGKNFVHISLRLPTPLRNQLKEEAEHRKVTLSSLINTVLLNFVSFNKILASAKTIPVSGAFLRELIEVASTEQMESIGKKLGPKVVRQAFAFMGVPFSLDNVIKHYFEPLSSESGWYIFNTSFEGTNRKLMFSHSHGPQWTAFLKRYIAGIIYSATGSEPEIAIVDEMLTFTIR